mgnify:FL=1
MFLILWNAAFGDSQEMVAFITELNANYYSLWFIRENGSDQYYRHNKGLLFDDRQKLILGQMEELENTMKRGLKKLIFMPISIGFSDKSWYADE